MKNKLFSDIFTKGRRLPIIAVLFSIAFNFLNGATVTYSESSDDFKNPERGFWGETVNRKYISIGNWKNSDLPQSFLDNLEDDFNDYRRDGKKMVPRFNYSWSANDDASLEQMLSHIEQLRPVFERNYDVIAMLEAGFVGRWGEWHSSATINSAEDRRAVLFKLLDVMPKDRMVGVRYNYIKRESFDSNEPLTIEEAFSGSDKARTAAQNDCFCTKPDDTGTYLREGDRNGWGLGYEAERDFLSADNLYVSQEGETCNLGDLSYASCEKGLEELTRMRWDMLNASFYKGILNNWKNLGCYDEIKRRLGYRIVLIDGTFDDEVTDGIMNAMLRLKNVGFGKMFNPRRFEVVLRNVQNGDEHVLPLWHDPRFWSPGQERTLDLQLHIPDTVPFGTYSLFLSLQDPAPQLYGIPEYAVRLANEGTWDADNGYNSLQHNLVVSSHSFVPQSVEKGVSSEKRFKINTLLGKPGSMAVEMNFYNTKPQHVSIDVHDLSGKQVVNLVNGNRSEGSHKIVWNGVNESGSEVNEGVCFVTYRSGKFFETRRIVLRK